MNSESDKNRETISGSISAESYLPFVRYAAKRFIGRGTPYDELVQCGSLGLWKAWLKFDPKRKVPFASFAFPFIEGEIRRAVRKNQDAARTVPDALIEKDSSIDTENGSIGTENRIVQKLQLRESLAALSEKERAVINLRYFRGLTQIKTSEVLCVSQSQISKLENKGLAKLKDMLGKTERFE